MDTIAYAPSKSRQAANLIKAEIESLGLRPNERLLTARQFAEKLGVSKQVVQSAFSILEEEGVIETKARCGTFVAQGAVEPKKRDSSVLSIGLLLHSGCDSYGMSVVKGLYEDATLKGLKIRTVCVKDFGSDAIASAKELRDEGCAALAIPCLPRTQISELSAFIRSCGLPVSVPLLIPGFERNSVKAPGLSTKSNGDTQLARTACEYFRRLGERNIALLGTASKGVVAMESKLSGYSEYMDAHGLEKRVALVGSSAKEMDAAARGLAELKGSLAVIAYDDTHALRFMTAMHKLGLSAPGDFRIIGDNDSQEAAFSDPPLTSARADFARIGSEILRCAVALAQGGEWHSSWMGAKELVVRESCGGLAKATPGFLDGMDACGLKISIASKLVEEERWR
jgi:DNA-binding LacI/PurR family transcriptional regulator